MASERETSLRRAEKLLRQGRLDAAIEEYRRVIEAQPGDWNTTNLLGDLYVRAGQVERAAEQFNKVADHYASEGFLPKAIALYRKVLKIAPENEHALVRSSEVAGRQGLMADARSALSTVAELRRRRGDKRGAAEVAIKMAALDPADPALALEAARAALLLGRRAEALDRFRETAALLGSRGQANESIRVLEEALAVEPGDAATRAALVGAMLEAGDLDGARNHASGAGQLKMVAEALEAAGRADQSRAALAEALRLEPDDHETRSRLLRALADAGRWEEASALVPDAAPDEADMAFLCAEVLARNGEAERGAKLIDQALAGGTLTEGTVFALASRLAPASADAAYKVVELVASRAVAGNDWESAADTLRRFVELVPGHIPALSRLVEVSVDGELTDSLSAAQAGLAEAYMASGHAAEARVIAEDLVTREPWNQAHVERLRSILETLGEEDVDQVIADRLGAVSLLVDPVGEFREAMTEEEPGARLKEDGKVRDAAGNEEPAGAERHGGTVEAGETLEAAGASTPGEAFAAGEANGTWLEGEPAFELGVETGDSAPGVDDDQSGERLEAGGLDFASSAGLDSDGAYVLESVSVEDIADILGTDDRPGAASPDEPLEIDLSDALGASPETEMKAVPAGAAAGPARGGAESLEAAFEDLRQEVLRDRTADAAEQHYKLGLMYRDNGLAEQAIEAFKLAARAPRYRFEAAALVARMYRERGCLDEAIEWFERAAEAPSDAPSAAHQLLYDLADVLEAAGETERSLAVLLELETNAGPYRDVAARIARLRHT